jgi:Terminase RNaseH-like domain
MGAGRVFAIMGVSVDKPGATIMAEDVLEYEDEDLEDLDLDEYEDESDEEREAREATEVILDENDTRFVQNLVDKLMTICDVVSGSPLRRYQKPFARRIFESLILDDGATLTALFARQTGKSETVAAVIATAMIMLPPLAKAFPDWLGKFARGVRVGAFAPVDDQADTLFGRIVSKLTSQGAVGVMTDPDINARLDGKGKVVYIKFLNSPYPMEDGKGHSLVRRTSCHPRSTIEGKTYEIILIDECQGADEKIVNKSVSPMGAATNATAVYTGTPTYTKGIFYNQIQNNKRDANKRGRSKVNHFEVEWKEAAKENAQYKKYVYKEMEKYGADSDEFKLSYRLLWLLDKGMFTTSEKLDNCADTRMQALVPAYNLSPVVVGIDCARKQDRTIVTVIFVDWERQDALGMYHHRILNWLDLEGCDWETQYFKIMDFLANYSVWKIGIDAGGVGDVVAERLRILMPQIEVVEFDSSQTAQSVRWKYLRSLIDRRQVVWPGGSKVRRLKVWRRFRQEMEDLEIQYKGPYVLAEAPNTQGAHDDYADSLAIGCYLTKNAEDEEGGPVEVAVNPFYNSRARRG